MLRSSAGRRRRGDVEGVGVEDIADVSIVVVVVLDYVLIVELVRMGQS